MIFFPKDISEIQNLNSYYLDIRKLFEHYQGAIDAGVVYFKSPTVEGAVFFDEDSIINAVLYEKSKSYKQTDAIERLIGESVKNNFNISIYSVSSETILFWANFADAIDLYKDLSSEFTDLEGLIKKMQSEKLTGYIKVDLNKSNKIGYLFFIYGDVISAADSINKELQEPANMVQAMIVASRKNGGIFNVRKISFDNLMDSVDAIETKTPEVKPITKEKIQEAPLKVIEMLQQLMVIFDKIIIANKNIKEDFDTILKRKFMQKVDKFEFLDPFAAEFEYSNGKINFTGDADNKQLAFALIECLQEIAAENTMHKWMKKNLGPWADKYQKEIKYLDIKL